MQFSIRRLFLMTFLVAIVCAAFAYAQETSRWLPILHVGLMAIAVLCLVSGPGHRRPFWFGFILGGLAYPCFPGPSITRAVAQARSMQEGVVVSYLVGILVMIAAAETCRRLFDRSPSAPHPPSPPPPVA